MALEFQEIKFSCDGKGGQTGTQTATFSGPVNSAHAMLVGFYSYLTDGGEKVRTAEAAITDVSISSQAVNVTATLNIQPTSDSHMTGWITAVVIADVAD